MDPRRAQLYLRLMAAYWMVFGFITAFYPRLMDLFQTADGISARTDFSDHVWFHGGLDILAFCILLLAIAREAPSPKMVGAAGVAALMPTLAIGYSIVATPYWSPLFIVAGAGCLAFAVWGLALAASGRTQ
jgi:hypothetical protein